MVDELLIKRIRAGDEDASEILVRKYYLQIMRFCRWQCGNADLAEDLAQETFLKAFKSLDQYRMKGHFKAWLFLYSIAKTSSIVKSVLSVWIMQSPPIFFIMELMFFSPMPLLELSST